MTAPLILGAPLAGWAIPLAATPDPVFASGMMGAGLAIDPTGQMLHAPCDATVVGVHAAGHAVTLRTADGAEMLLHIGIDTVALGGEGFSPLVAAGASVVAGQPLIAFDLDLIVCRASAAVTPMLLVAGAFAVEPIASERAVAVGDPVLRLVPGAPPAAAEMGGKAVERQVVVALPHGLHARPAARIAAAARGLAAHATLRCLEREADALSITAMLGLGATHGAAVTIAAAGADAAALADAIAAILGETQEPDAAPARPTPAPDRDALPPGALVGVAAAPGLGIGTTRRLRIEPPVVPGGAVDATGERAALDAGLRRLRAALDTGAGVLAAHRALLDDPALLGAFDRAIADGGSAAGGVLTATAAQAGMLAASPDPRLAERGADLIDIGQRLAHAILGTTPAPMRLSPGTILIADDLLPSHFAAIDTAMLAGIALAGGGPTAHVAIMAAGRGVPMVVALGRELDAIGEGGEVILDGDGGFLDTTPDAGRLAAARERSAAAARAEAAAAGGAPAATRDGRAIGIHVNLGTAAEAAAGVAAGAQGCGLLRTELLFLDRAAPPGRDEQAALYRAIATALDGRPLTVRLLDVGGDKPAPYLAIAREENPALGLRGVRVLLAEEALLTDQLAAIVAAGDAGPLRVMVPMVTSADEMAAVRATLDRLRGDRAFALGAMIETPAAAIAADLIAAHCDFLSIGSNDLTQYALAMDRGNPAVAAGIDGLHPAVLRLIAATCDGAARHGVPVGLCGSLAADPLAAPILVGLGIGSLSVPPGRVAAMRALVAALSHAEAVAHARAALACSSAAAVRTLARAFAREMPR